MSTFISLCTFERQGLGDIVKTGKKISPLLKALAKEFGNGTKVKSIWLTTGAYDLVVVIEAPDMDSAVSFVMALNVVGVCLTTTLAAVGNLDKVIKAASDAHTKMHTKMDDKGA